MDEDDKDKTKVQRVSDSFKKFSGTTESEPKKESNFSWKEVIDFLTPAPSLTETFTNAAKRAKGVK